MKPRRRKLRSVASGLVGLWALGLLAFLVYSDLRFQGHGSLTGDHPWPYCIAFYVAASCVAFAIIRSSQLVRQFAADAMIGVLMNVVATPLVLLPALSFPSWVERGFGEAILEDVAIVAGGLVGILLFSFAGLVGSYCQHRCTNVGRSCTACGYDLTGLPGDGRCPECGSEIGEH